MSYTVIDSALVVTVTPGDGRALLDDVNGTECCCPAPCVWIFDLCGCESATGCPPQFFASCNIVPPDIAPGKVYRVADGAWGGTCCIVAVEMTETPIGDEILGEFTEYTDCETCCEDTGEPGACCDPDDGTCIETSLATCISQGGVFQGVGTDCGPPNPCPQPAIVACCFDDGTCQDLTEDACLAAGGTPTGNPGDLCANVECDEPAANCANCTVQACPADEYKQIAPSVSTQGTCPCSLPAIEAPPEGYGGGHCIMAPDWLFSFCPDEGGFTDPTDCPCGSGGQGMRWERWESGCAGPGGYAPFPCFDDPPVVVPENTWFIVSRLQFDWGGLVDDIWCLFTKGGTCPDGSYTLAAVSGECPPPPGCSLQSVGTYEIVPV